VKPTGFSLPLFPPLRFLKTTLFVVKLLPGPPPVGSEVNVYLPPLCHLVFPFRGRPVRFFPPLVLCRPQTIFLAFLYFMKQGLCPTKRVVFVPHNANNPGLLTFPIRFNSWPVLFCFCPIFIAAWGPSIDLLDVCHPCFFFPFQAFPIDVSVRFPQSLYAWTHLLTSKMASLSFWNDPSAPFPCSKLVFFWVRVPPPRFPPY